MTATTKDPATKPAAPTTPADSGKTRKRSPAYDVFERVTLDEPLDGLPNGAVATDAFVLLEEHVKADSAKDAIAKITADFHDARKYGTFWAPLTGTFKPVTRSRKVVETEDWSS